MTCTNCVAKVKSELLKIGEVTEADVQLASPQATITMQRHVPLAALQSAVSKAGAYTISESGTSMEAPAEKRSWLATYKPILLIGGYITAVTLLIEAAKGGFDAESWMAHFMAGFFLVFSFFKFLDLEGFAQSYSSYDIIARKWSGWGYVYAFIELGLGLAYLTGLTPVATNVVTLVVMGVSITGVMQTVLAKRKISCACLGAVFNLPMSTVTVVEDALMIGMSAVTLLMIF